MNIKIYPVKAFALVAAGILLLGPGSRADDWFLLGERTIKATDPNTDVKSEGDRWHKDVKRVKFSVEGSDVEITKIVLNWDNRPDKTITEIGTIKASGQTAEVDAPGRKGRLTGVKIQYKILGNAPTAIFKIWGYD
jgi:hypothetical protein